MTSVSERKQYVTWIREAKESGARLPLACEEAGISLRTYKRWYQEDGKVLADKRPDAVRPEPSNKLYRGRSAAPKGAKAPAVPGSATIMPSLNRCSGY